jgi:hypothetical protein
VRVDAFCHVPGIRLPAGCDLDLGDGARLIALPFKEWVLLEDPVMTYHDRRYDKVAPAFLIAPLPAADSRGVANEAQNSAFEDALERASIACLLAWPGIRLPHPRLSAHYIRWADLPLADKAACEPAVIDPDALADEIRYTNRTSVWLWHGDADAKAHTIVERRTGLVEREWLLGGSGLDSIVIDAEQLPAFKSFHAKLLSIDTGSNTPALLRLADILRMATEPDVDYDDLVVQLVAVLEHITNPNGERPLAKLFSMRASALLAKDTAGLPETTEVCRAIYSQRSDILHGDGMPASTSQSENALLAMAWTAMARLVRIGYRTGGEANGLKRLRIALAKPTQQQALATVFEELGP